MRRGARFVLSMPQRIPNLGNLPAQLWRLTRWSERPGAAQFRIPMFMHSRLLFSTAFAAVSFTSASAAEWRPLFDGTFHGWKKWLAFPHESVEVAGLKRAADGKYTEPLGWNRDPLDVLRIDTVDGRPAMHFGGPVFGYVVTEESFSNYHLRLQFKWGEKRYPPRDTVVRDSGLLFHVHSEGGKVGRTWPLCVEQQIQEHDCGDLWTVGTQITVRARRLPDLAKNGDTLYIYDPKGDPVLFGQAQPIGSRCIKGEDHEKPFGEWNVMELVCLGEESIYIVNGHVVMRLSGPRQPADGTSTPFSSGAIGLQAEGAEVYFRDIEIRPLTALPAEFAEK